MDEQRDPAAVVLEPREGISRVIAPGIAVAELLNDSLGCRGLHQRRLALTEGATASGSADGVGESWYVLNGSGRLAPGNMVLPAQTAVWLPRDTAYSLTAESACEILATTIRAGSPEAGAGLGAGAPAARTVALADCEPERTGDREFRVLLSSGLRFTQFVGEIPPGRAPVHHHTYDEVVYVLSGHGVVHLGGEDAGIGPGTSIYLPPYTEHCLENTGTEVLRVLGVFHPAGSPAVKHEAARLRPPKSMRRIVDPASIVLPGAQSLVAEILSDGWAQVRGWLAQRWSRHSGTSKADLERRLDDAHAQAESLCSGSRDRAVLEAYWTGYLAALLGEHPEFAASLRELKAPDVTNTVSGTVTGTVVQAGTIAGGITFGRSRRPHS